MADGWTRITLSAKSLRYVYTLLRDRAEDAIKINDCDRESAPANALPAASHSELLDGELSPLEAPPHSLTDDDIDHIKKLAAVASQALIDSQDNPRLLSDNFLLEQMEALRGMLELAYGQRITFRGEERKLPTGTMPPSSEFASLRAAARDIRRPVEPNITGKSAAGSTLELPREDLSPTVDKKGSRKGTKSQRDRR
jgi:hypothetical protein